MPRLTRRGFLAAGGAVAASGLRAGRARAQEAGAGAGPAREYDIECRWLETTLDATRVRLRGYNGQVPGPLLETRPGETLRIRLRNSLSPYDSSGWPGDHNVPHGLDSTNLHVHGLEVTPHLFEPLGTSRPLASMISLGPGAEKRYEFRIPEDHPSGLFWYHPHKHGSTAVQAVSGMAGGLVVRGPIDELPEIEAAREIFVVVNDIGLFPSEEIADLWVYEPVQNSVWSTLGSQVLRWNPATRTMEPAPGLQGGFTTGDYKLRYFLVNGRPFFKERHDDANPTAPIGTQLSVPRFTLRPGEVVRFRMLNACSDNLMPVVVEGHELHLLALDGVNFPEPRTLAVKPIDGRYGGEQLLLAPANRAEFLLRAGAPGRYRIGQLEQTQQFLRSAPKTIAEIEVQGPPLQPPMAIPARLPVPTRHYPLIDAGEIRRRRSFVFSGAFPGVLNPVVGIDFTINNAQYDERAVPTVVDVGSAEEWSLAVPDVAHGGSEGHPFHIHVNSFEVISVGGKLQPPGTIQDTVWIQAGSQVVIRMKFRQWTGKAVLHCHILPHEDTGMMQNFLIGG
jgi:FtsP/CotA-like multicopper oxidase with cupredoxin domain